MPARMPVQAAFCLGTIQLQVMRLMRVLAAIRHPARALTPCRSEPLHDPLHRLGIFIVRAEVPAFGIGRAFFIELLRQHQITGQRLQHMLPGAGGVGVADVDRTAFCDGAHDIRNEPVVCPIAAADDVARPAGSDRHAMLFVFIRMEVGVAVCGRHQFCAALAAGVGIVTAHRFILAVAPCPFAVLVTLIGGDIHHRLHAVCAAHRFKQIHCAHHVGGVGVDRFDIGIAHQRLRRHVDHDLGFVFGKHRAQMRQIADVSYDAGHALTDFGNLEQAGVRRRSQRVTHHLSTHGLQPERQPASFEAGVSG